MPSGPLCPMMKRQVWTDQQLQCHWNVQQQQQEVVVSKEGELHGSSSIYGSDLHSGAASFAVEADARHLQPAAAGGLCCGLCPGQRLQVACWAGWPFTVGRLAMHGPSPYSGSALWRRLGCSTGRSGRYCHVCRL